MVRKRKNSEETPAAPRLTRQRRNLDEDDDLDSTLVEKGTKSSRTPKPTRKRALNANEDVAVSTRSRRRPALKSSSDSDIENNSEPRQPSARKMVREDSLGTDSYTTRSRAAKKETNTTNHDSTALGAENEVEAPLTEPKRQTKKKKVLSAADNTLTDNSSSFKAATKQTRSQAKTAATKTAVNLVADPPAPQEQKTTVNSPVESKIKKSATLRRIVETPRKVSPRRQQSALPTLSVDTVTPESSPMLVNLTPHRSTKTPKKSPVNIGSPKTHSQSPLRLSKTPRKLTIGVESPATSDKSSGSLSVQNLSKAGTSSANLCDPFVMLTDINKDCSPSLAKTISDDKEASKSPPKLVSVAKLRLRTSQGKTTTDKTLPAKLSDGGDKLATKPNDPSSYLTVDEIWAEVSAASPQKKSPAKKLGTLASKVRKSPIKTPVSIRKTASATPVKTRLSAAQIPRNTGSTPNRTPKNTPPNVKQRSPKRPKSTLKKRSPVTSSGTPLRPVSVSTESPRGKSGGFASSKAPKKINLLLELASTSPESTPRGRIRRSLHLTPDFVKLSTGFTSSPIPTPKKSGSRVLSPEFSSLAKSNKIDDESVELVEASKLINLSNDESANSAARGDGTYNLSKEITLAAEKEKGDKSGAENETYELAEPKTPSLQRKSRKRSLSNVEPDGCTPEAKKRCRVRFASPAQENQLKIVPAEGSGSRKSVPTVNTPMKQRIGGRLSRGSLTVDSIRRRSRSLTKADEKTPVPRSGMKRRSISASSLSNKTPKLSQSTQNSVNRLSRPRQSISSEAKVEVKLPVPRRAPNFAQIHQKKFEQMESLVDAKKRVAKRHVELSALPPARGSPSTSAAVPEPAPTNEATKKPTPPKTQNNMYNRFGFKLRKNEAIKVIAKKPPAGRSKNHQENNRSILKGVRTNRRFELQMKARNLKQ